jgi:hypothetical protein
MNDTEAILYYTGMGNDLPCASLDCRDSGQVTRIRHTFLSSYGEGTATGTTSIPKITYTDASKAEDARLTDALLQRFCALAV